VLLVQEQLSKNRIIIEEDKTGGVAANVVRYRGPFPFQRTSRALRVSCVCVVVCVCVCVCACVCRRVSSC
jgi:hypothetical protein